MNIVLVCAMSTPIPAVRGGATETMMTHMLEVNEKLGCHHFHVMGYFDEEAEKQSRSFTHCTFYNYYPKGKKDFVNGLFWRGLRKITNEYIFLRPNYVKWCAHIINSIDIDVVVLEGNCFHVEYFRSLIGNKKLILHMHIDRLNVELKSSKRIIAASDGVFAISEFCKKRMIEVDNACANKVIVVKNTIDTERFQYQGDAIRKMIRDKFGVKPNQKVVSYCGRIDSTKGVLELVKAVKSLHDPNIHILIIGSSVYFGSGKNEYIKLLENEAKSIVGGVSFTGYVSQSELPSYLSGSDLAIVPSLCKEAAGNVTIEALSCGIPVLASSQGGIPEYADLKACRLVDYDSLFIDNLAKQIHAILYNEYLYNELKTNARGIALQYDKHNYYVNFCDAITKILLK